jgi:hypothetical protein
MPDIFERTYIKRAEDVAFSLITGLDLTGYVAADLTITVKRPAGTTFTVTQNRAIHDAPNGVIGGEFQYQHLDETGEYFIQVKASAGGLPTIQSMLTSFFVDDDAISALTTKWAFGPPTLGVYTSESAANKAFYAFWTNPTGFYSNGDAGARFI